MAKEKPETKLCRYCKTEISYDAKVCPNCRRKQKKGFVKWVVLAVVIVVIIFIVFAILGSDSTTMPEPKEVSYVEQNDFAKVYTDANDYKGKYMRFTGQVFNVERDDKGVYLQVYEDMENFENNTYVTYEGDLDIQTDDYISVDGYITGTISGKNALGGTVTIPSVVAKNVEKLSYIEAVVPAIETIEVGKTINKSDYELSLDKIEFAEKETRIYFTFKNGGDGTYSLYTSSVKVVQGTKQLESTYNYEGDYPELQSEVQSGVETSGIVVFEAMQPDKDFTVSVSGYDDKSYEDSTFEFQIAVK